MRWFGHVCHFQEDTLTRRVFETKPVGNNKRGRHRKTWEDYIKEVVKKGFNWTGIKIQ